MSSTSGLKERKSLQLTTFLGLDKVHTPYKVDSRRASEMSNFIMRDGTVRKRNGWKTLSHLTNEKILSMHPFTEIKYDEDTLSEYKEDVILLFTINNMYRVNTSTNESTSIDGYIGGYKTIPQVFINNGNAYIVSGYTYFVYGRTSDDSYVYSLREVFDDSKTYVPKTTIGISKSTADEEGTRQSLDEVNLMTNWRINTLIGSNGDGYYILDGTPFKNSVMTIKINSLTVNETYTMYANDFNIESGSYTVLSYDYSQNKIMLGDLDLSPKVSGEANIEIKFYCWESRHSHAGTTDTFPDRYYIDKCKIGAMFGTNNETSRLFLSGNEDHRNMDFHSAYGDLSYFPDINYRYVGSDTYAITGYARLNDSTLCIFKEENPQEPTVWYRTASYDNETTQFYDVSGTLGETAIGNNCNVNFYGDSIILTKNGLFGVVQTSNYQTNQRYAIERTELISPVFKSMDLDKSCIGIYGDNLYFTCDGETYVCDRKYNSKTSQSSYNYYYEWWKLDGIDATCYMTYGGKLYFGTKDGKIKCFYDGFKDIDFEVHNNITRSGTMLAVHSTTYEKLSIGSKIKLSFNATIKTTNAFSTKTETYNAGTELYVVGMKKTGSGENAIYKISISPNKELAQYDTSEITSVTNGNTMNIIEEKSINAIWYTPILDFGSTMVAKTLLGITISAEQMENGTMTFGYQTSNTIKDYVHRGLQVYNDDEMDYEYYSFSLGFQNAYTKKMNVRNFTFIKFKFANDSDQDFAINSFACLYKFNKKNIGVR